MSRRVTGAGNGARDPEQASDVGPAFTEGPGVSRSDWPLSSSLVLGALPTAAPCARLHARAIMWEWGIGAATDSVELVVSELVTNAVIASRGADGRPRYVEGAGLPCVRIRVSSDHVHVLIEVWDENPRTPAPKPAHLDEEGGRGLMLVDAVSERWNWDVVPGWAGKVVWAKLRLL